MWLIGYSSKREDRITQYKNGSTAQVGYESILSDQTISDKGDENYDQKIIADTMIRINIELKYGFFKKYEILSLLCPTKIKTDFIFSNKLHCNKKKWIVQNYEI